MSSFLNIEFRENQTLALDHRGIGKHISGASYDKYKKFSMRQFAPIQLDYLFKISLVM